MSAADTHPTEPTVAQRRPPDPGEPIPALAAPTVALYVAALMLFGGSTALALAGSLAHPFAIAINTIASYLLVGAGLQLRGLACAEGRCRRT